LSDNNRRIGFRHAWNGIKELFKTEKNFRFQSFAALAVIVAGIIFGLSAAQWLMIIIAIGFVLVTEALNTSVEKIIDYVKPEYHPKARVIKDIAAGAVLIAAITAVMIGLIIFIPEISVFF